MHQDLIPTAEACKILDIHRDTLAKWIKAGDVTPIRPVLGLRQPMFFDRAQIEALRDSRQARRVSPSAAA